MAVEVCIGHDRSKPLPADLDQLDADTLRRLLTEQERELVWRQTKIERLTHEVALHRHHRFGVKAERLSSEQVQLFEETAEADLVAMSEELAQLQPDTGKSQARRKPLQPELPRTETLHEPGSTSCTCGRPMHHIGGDVAEKLDYAPGPLHRRTPHPGQVGCSPCETLVQAPVPAYIIDKGIPTVGLLAQVLVAKYLDQLLLYRQEAIFGRAGLAIPQSTLAQWVGQSGVHLQPLVDALKRELLAHPVLHADETPVAMLDPGAGKTHRACLWSYSVGAFDPIKAVAYSFADSRAGRHAQAFPGEWRGTLRFATTTPATRR